MIRNESLSVPMSMHCNAKLLYQDEPAWSSQDETVGIY